MRKFLFLILALCTATVLFAEERSSEQRVLDDLIIRINSPSLGKQIRLLSRVNPPKFMLHPFKYSAGFKNNKLEPTETDQKNGFVTFVVSSESKVPHNYVPSQNEIDAKMSLAGARKSVTAGFFGFMPLREGEGDAFLKVSELKNEAGDVLDPASVNLFSVMHLIRKVHGLYFNFYFEPHGLEPITSATPLKLRDKVSDSVYVEVQIPQNAKPGTYVGELEFSANNVSVKRPIEIIVYDFELAKLPFGEMNWGLFSFVTPDTHENHYKFLASHGINSLSAGWSSTDKVVNHVKKIRNSGIDGELLISVSALDIQAIGKAKPYSPEWRKIYGGEIKKLNELMISIGETNDRWIGGIYDEPRETMPNPWNISFAETMEHYDLIGEYAPGLRRTANPTGDGPTEAFARVGDKTKTQYPDGVYTEFVKPPRAVEVFNTHYWDHSKNMIKLAKQNNIPIWGFNDGDNRYAWGLQNFKIGTKARFLYAYWPRSAYAPTPIYPIQVSGYEFPGNAATPPYALPFSDEVIWSTCKLKNLRDGISDYRYFFMLKELVKAKPDNPIAIEAKQYMDELINRMPESAYDITGVSEYDVGTSDDGVMGMEAIRRKIAEYIEKLQ